MDPSVTALGVSLVILFGGIVALIETILAPAEDRSATHTFLVALMFGAGFTMTFGVIVVKALFS